MNDQLLTRVQVEIEGLNEFLLIGFPVVSMNQSLNRALAFALVRSACLFRQPD